jgi:hypothetical protein
MALYPIFMRRVAFRLEMRGFKVIKISPNKKKPQFNVYYFEDTKELHDALFEVTRDKKK